MSVTKKSLRNVGRLLKTLLLAISHRLARFNTHLLMIISFFLILLPIGLIRRLFWRPSRGWQEREPLKRTHFEKQY